MANTTAAIMAIPGPLEPIRLVGDEDKHATLLFLGETNTLPDTAKQTLIDAVELASGMMFPFSESVIDVVRLGSDVPPALVAMLSSDNIGFLRNLFLMNTDVNGFLGNVAQHPQFNPHVTLGHPDFTDEAILRALMKQVWRVRFDRLAVWWNDERTEFDLGPAQDSMAMSEAVENFLAHVSTKPWSDYTAADYTPEQYKAACLVVRGDGSTKEQCKLPVKTPNGALSKPGVHAAAAAIAGARGGVDLTQEERTSAKKKLLALYGQLGEEAPLSLAHALIALEQATENDAQQHGIKGQKWGVRRFVDAATGRVEQTGRTGLVSKGSTDVKVSVSGKTKATGGSFKERRAVNKALKAGVVKADPKALLERGGLKPRTGSADQIAQDRIASKIATTGTKSLSNADIQAYTRRLQLTKDLDAALASQSAAVQKQADGFIKNFVKTQGNRQTNRILNAAADIAIEKAIGKAGVKLGDKNPELGSALKEVSTRIKPKKK